MVSFMNNQRDEDELYLGICRKGCSLGTHWDR